MRLAAARALVALLLFSAAVAHADSNGVVPIAGTWTGTLSSSYWDQTSGGSVRPKLRYKAKVTVVIAETNGTITSMIISFPNPGLPMTSTPSFAPQMTLSGFSGNYHTSAALDSNPAITLSGSTNKKGTSLKMTGVAATTDFTHELKISLRKSH
jgi:hypothetical protein